MQHYTVLRTTTSYNASPPLLQPIWESLAWQYDVALIEVVRNLPSLRAEEASEIKTDKDITTIFSQESYLVKNWA